MSRNQPPGNKPEFADLHNEALIDIITGEQGSGSRLLTLTPPEAWAIGRLPVEELARRGNLPTEAATRLGAALELAHRIREERSADRSKLANTRTALSWLWDRAVMADVEEAWLLMLDADQHLIASKLLAVGTRRHVALDVPAVLRPALECNAHSILLLHNHIEGELFPSEKDIAFTLDLQKAAQFVEVHFVDHYLVDRKRNALSILEWVSDLVKKDQAAKQKRKARRASKAPTSTRRPKK